MTEILKVDRRKTRLRSGVGHDGKSRALAKPGDKVLGVHHTPVVLERGMEHQKTPNTIAQKSTTPKMHPAVPIHKNMTARQQELRGMGHAVGSAPDASAANPLDPTAPGKVEKPLMVHPSMQRTPATFNGERVLAEAIRNR